MEIAAQLDVLEGSADRTTHSSSRATAEAAQRRAASQPQIQSVRDAHVRISSRVDADAFEDVQRLMILLCACVSLRVALRLMACLVLSVQLTSGTRNITTHSNFLSQLNDAASGPEVIDVDAQDDDLPSLPLLQSTRSIAHSASLPSFLSQVLHQPSLSPSLRGSTPSRSSSLGGNGAASAQMSPTETIAANWSMSEMKWPKTVHQARLLTHEQQVSVAHTGRHRRSLVSGASCRQSLSYIHRDAHLSPLLVCALLRIRL
jgi:hypothetical protein